VSNLPRTLPMLVGAALAATAFAAPPVQALDGLQPVLSGLNLTYSAIHAVGVTGTHLPKKTQLMLTLNVDALVRVRVKDTNPYGLSRAFNVELPAGDSAVPISARVDATKMPPGKYLVVVKAHNSAGSSDKFTLRLRIVGKNG
jgi:hypothetical protein